MEWVNVVVREQLGRRTALLAAAGLTLAVLMGAVAQIWGGLLQRAVESLTGASPAWLWIAAAGFVTALVAAGGSWAAALRLCDARLGLLDASARYGCGSLVNSFVPGGAGGAVRLALFASALRGEARVWRAGGACAAIAAARSVILALLLAYAAASGAIPVWAVALPLAFASVVAVVAFATRRHETNRRVAHVFDAFSTLGRCPRRAAELLAWAGTAVAARVAAATAVAAAFGVESPLAAALIIVPALEIASRLAFTPANVGLSSGAVAIALDAHGVDLTTALSAGIALNAVETLVGISFGAGSALYIARFPSLKVRRLAFGVGGSAACLAVAAAVGASV